MPSPQAAKAIVCSVMMNVAIVGINQVYDKKLDRVSLSILVVTRSAGLVVLVSEARCERMFQLKNRRSPFQQVNKPYLPMASGALSPDAALSIIAVCTTCSLILGE